jgi:hypothetical protein
MLGFLFVMLMLVAVFGFIGIFGANDVASKVVCAVMFVFSVLTLAKLAGVL